MQRIVAYSRRPNDCVQFSSHVIRQKRSTEWIFYIYTDLLLVPFRYVRPYILTGRPRLEQAGEDEQTGRQVGTGAVSRTAAADVRQTATAARRLHQGRQLSDGETEIETKEASQQPLSAGRHRRGAHGLL